ncbi:MAG: flagellar hook-basal body protein [Lachnospiraceae bacterium]|nr:flagellar hook-basal body protein [Lachnospiraceae bacterium]
MVRGLYTAYTGMINQQKRMDTVTNNLANASTTGYKREGVTSKSFKEVLGVKIKDLSVPYLNEGIGYMSLGVKIGENYTDYSQGSFKETGNTYDLGLDGQGFFAISFTDKNGNESVKYTRDGQFTTDVDGYLRTLEGDYVQGDAGNIMIPTDAQQVSINQQGEIYADGEYVDTIQIVDFEDYNYIKKYGENLYDIVDGATEIESDAKIRQGYLEMSNINVVNEMVEMITISRAYESNQKLIQTTDSMLEKSVNEVGKV